MPVITLESLELRWFDRGPLPAQVREWFGTLPHPKGTSPLPERRTDVYLPTPGAHNVSVKLSRGALETKLRLDQSDFGSADGRIRGVSERWTKWSWRYDSTEAAVYRAFETEQRADWVELEKARAQRKFRIENGAPVPIPANARVGLGYAVEIVDGLYRGLRWWSVGVDAFAPDEQRIRTLLGDGVRLLEQSFPLSLTREHSMSYPAWVDRLTLRSIDAKRL